MAEGTPPAAGYAPPLGYGAAIKEAQFVAAPLLTAAALSLAGVVAGADKEFRLPGATLIVLVIAAMTLIFSMQLAYRARAYLFTYKELTEHYEGVPGPAVPVRRAQQEYMDARVEWVRRNNDAVFVYNVGTLLLGLGVAVSLIPPPCGEEALARWIAAGIVCIGTVADGTWVVRQYISL